ncbi:MAG: hypothetical protein CUN52_11165, partial [Phototrophicales bacterium]
MCGCNFRQLQFSNQIFAGFAKIMRYNRGMLPYFNHTTHTIMNNKQKNLEKVIHLLRIHPDGISIRDIADRLGCNASTAYRYLQELQDDLQPIYEVERGHYRLDLSVSQYSLSLRPKEALMIYLALRRYIRQTSRAPRFLISALNRIAGALQRQDLVNMLRE